MEDFEPRVEGVSDVVRLIEAGKIRLGYKAKSKNGKEYPKAADHFVVKHLPEVVAVYGETPKSLDICLPLNDLTKIYPQELRAYGGNKALKCHGNGVVAQRYNDTTESWERREVCRDGGCDWYTSKKCSFVSQLWVVLPKVDMFKAYRIISGSFNTTVNLNTFFKQLAETFNGKIRGIPITLKLVEITNNPVVSGKRIASQNYVIVPEAGFKADYESVSNILSGDSGFVLPASNLALPAIDPSKEVLTDDSDPTLPVPTDSAPNKDELEDLFKRASMAMKITVNEARENYIVGHEGDIDSFKASIEKKEAGK